MVGSILLLQHYYGSSFFNQPWPAMLVQQGSHSWDYWIGLTALNGLTTGCSGKLLINLQGIHGWYYYEEYSTFSIGDASTNFTLKVGDYISGNVGGNPNGTMAYQNGMMFSTYDKNNDPYHLSHPGQSCAVMFGGAWWYNACADAAFTGSSSQFHVAYDQGQHIIIYLQYASMKLLL